MPDSDVNKLLRLARRGGMVVIHSRRHWSVTNPQTGARTTVSVSPNGSRWRANVIADLRRLGLDI